MSDIEKRINAVVTAMDEESDLTAGENIAMLTSLLEGALQDADAADVPELREAVLKALAGEKGHMLFELCGCPELIFPAGIQTETRSR